MTQTILGAGGQIAVELARELCTAFNRNEDPSARITGDSADTVRLVSRTPHKVNSTDTLAAADLTDFTQTKEAVEGSEVVYFTAGLPPRSDLWEQQFPIMLSNALVAARAVGAKFAYFDNTYMYPREARIQTEETPFAPVGRKGKVRARMATMVLEEMHREEIPVLIARAPEFYGPGRTQSFSNFLIIDRIKNGKRPFVPVRADRRRSLIWTPDASRALATLGNCPGAYGQTWHLPIDDYHPTYRQFVAMAAQEFGTEAKYTVLPGWALKAAGAFSPEAREIKELLPRYGCDNLFDSTKFRTKFPDFKATTYREGMRFIREEAKR